MNFDHIDIKHRERAAREFSKAGNYGPFTKEEMATLIDNAKIPR